MRIVLVYSDYFTDGVGMKTEELAEEGTNKVYHIHQEDAEVFIKENGPFTKILFTENISAKYKQIFSKKPYNAKKMT